MLHKLLKKINYIITGKCNHKECLHYYNQSAKIGKVYLICDICNSIIELDLK